MMQSNNKTIYETLGRDPVHPFPARMAPGIALEVIAKSDKSLRVLDPMMGSGTVLALARSKGHRAVGVDLDPLSVLISKVWTTAIDADAARKSGELVLQQARTIFEGLPSRDGYPPHSDDETKQFVRFWFDEYSRRQLAALATAIERVIDPPVRDLLWCAFSRLIIVKQAGASLAMDLSHSRPHKSFTRAPAKPFANFLRAVERVAANCIDAKTPDRGPATQVHTGDARQLPLDDKSIDLVLTSPPYLNAIDYMRCSKFSLVWMGYSIAELRKCRTSAVGTEVGKGAALEDEEVRGIIAKLNLTPQLTHRNVAILARYIDDMRKAIREVARVLVPGGKAVYVIGENTIRGTYIRTATIISALASQSGLHQTERHVRTLPASRRYLPPPTTLSDTESLAARMRKEVVLSFAQPSN